ncbi:Aste57867_228 [Aphanomyces stellatus]|uniref:Aste57867_228 protein n=1 Tax=Aphanomyces stellatus TaxID=120398 RepID=A0A485K789_9STRA|nr:hypothetical protein As57867_000228 [Aphanomyces stellatus]VFT77454.1 Aste57867_228 [Aphanomyces stellatus]
MPELDGAHFQSLPSALKAAKEFAAQCKYDVQVDRSFKQEDSKRLICRHRTQHACPWKLEVLKDPEAMLWRLVLADGVHSEGCEAARRPPQDAFFHPPDRSTPQPLHRPSIASGMFSSQITQSLLASSISTQPQSSLDADGRRSLLLTHDMRWGSAKEASRAVNDFALFVQKKRARMDKKTSGGRNKKYICSCEGCGWYVRLLRAPKAESWKISSMNLQHSDGCDGVAQPTARQLADMASFRQAVVTHTKAHGKLLTEDFLSTAEEGIKIPLRLAYRAKKLIAVNSQDDLIESYKFIPSLLATFGAKNPNSIVDYTVDATSHFVRAFVMPGVCAQASTAIQKIIGFEVVPCTSQDYKGFTLLLLGRDGNFQPQVLAFGLVPEPTTEHVDWFISLVRRGMNVDGFPFVCSVLHPGVVDGLRQVLPGVTIRFCIKSLVEAMNHDKMIPKLGPAEMLVWDLHYQESEAGFHESMTQLEHVNGPAATYLRGLNPDQWATYMIKEHYPTPFYKWSTTSFTSGLLGEPAENGDEAPFDLLYSFLTRMMDLTFLKSQLASKLPKDAAMLTPGAQGMYAEEITESLQYATRPCDDQLAFVWKTGARPKVTFRVHLGDGTCTCAAMHQLAMPCRHFIAAARHFGQDQLILNHFGAIYKTEAFVSAFHRTRIEIPLESDLSKDETLLPAVVDGKAAASASGKSKKQPRPANDTPNPRKEKMAKPAPATATDVAEASDMDMIAAMGMSMGIPGLTQQMLQGYPPIPPHAYLQQIQLQLQMQQQQQNDLQENQGGSSTAAVAPPPTTTTQSLPMV